MATATNDKPVRLGDLPVVKTNILENARQYDKGVVGGYSGTFPLTAASQGGIYLLPSTGKFYVCETAYNGAQISAPNSNFVELSVWKNHDRLANLTAIKKCIGKFNDIDVVAVTLEYPDSFNKYNCTLLALDTGNDMNSSIHFKIDINESKIIIRKLTPSTYRYNITIGFIKLY